MTVEFKEKWTTKFDRGAAPINEGLAVFLVLKLNEQPDAERKVIFEARSETGRFTIALDRSNGIYVEAENAQRHTFRTPSVPWEQISGLLFLYTELDPEKHVRLRVGRTIEATSVASGPWGTEPCPFRLGGSMPAGEDPAAFFLAEMVVAARPLLERDFEQLLAYAKREHRHAG